VSAGPPRAAAATPIRIGTQGWSYPDWVGVFYPPGVGQEHFLPFYARVFDTVELDTTFYHSPRPALVRSWARAAPAGFRFAAKFPRAITHEAGLAGVREEADRFVAAMAGLGERLGPLLLQLPASFRAEQRPVLEDFLAALPRGFRYAVELRHASWQGPATAELLARQGAAWAWVEWLHLPRIIEVTSDFLYLRWMGDRRAIERFDRVQIPRDAEHEAWERDLRPALPRVREVYGYFNNHWAGHSPASANDMKRRLGLAVVEPRSRWDQGELF
jgi:uncharacterized protein YecE (DUF72 family)